MIKAILGTALCLICTSGATADEIIKVSRSAWEGLNESERASIQSTKIVEIRDTGTYGTIVDNQGVDESTPGTNAGANIGAAMGQAAYIDRAFKPGNNYSAKNQVGAAILGAMVGAALDKPAIQQFHFRYAVKLADGEIRFVDSVQSNAFRHPGGLCVSIPDLFQLPQSVCNFATADLKRAYLSPAGMTMHSEEVASKAPAPLAGATQRVPDSQSSPAGLSTVMCKLGNLSPVQTTADKCVSIGGTAI
jgi:outer membrane lipoprotein SlyB